MKGVREFFSILWNIKTDRVGPLLIVGLVPIAYTYLSTYVKAEVDKLKEDSIKQKRRHHNALMNDVTKQGDVLKDIFIRGELRRLQVSPMKLFEDAPSISDVDYEDAAKLLDYYLTYPCADVVELNFLGDGYAILGENLEYLNDVNRLLCFVVGKRRKDQPKYNFSTTLAYLTNYKNLCHYLSENRSTKTSSNAIPPDHSKIALSLGDLYKMCSDATGNAQECNRFK
jgi:hypothetical protein